MYIQFFKPRNVRKPIFVFSNTEYYHYHTGLQGNQAYILNIKVDSKIMVAELIKLSDGRWCFHVEHKDNLILDSRLGGVFYDTPEQAHSGMLNALSDKFNPQVI
jgi:hypothetical protein